MAEELDMQKAKEVFDLLTKTLDNGDWKYEKNEEDLFIRSGIKGDDFPIKFVIEINPKIEVVRLFSTLPFNMPDEKRVDGAIAVCVANYGLVAGAFDYDLSDGEIRFRLSSSYRKSTLSPELFEYMIYFSSSIIDRYNDKFFKIANDMMTVQQFIEEEKR